MAEINGDMDLHSIMGVIDTYLRCRDITNKHLRSYSTYHPSAFGKCFCS